LKRALAFLDVASTSAVLARSLEKANIVGPITAQRAPTA